MKGIRIQYGRTATGMIETFSLGDHVAMRKAHACGGNEWEIIRSGADIKLKCCKCGHVVMLDRCDFLRSAKKILDAHKEPSND